MQHYTMQQPQVYQSQEWPNEPGTARAYDMQAPMNTSRQSPGTVTYVPTPTMIPAAMSPSYGQMSPPMSSRVGPNGTPGLPSMYSPNMGAANAAGGPHTPPFPGFEGVMAGGSLAANGDGGMSIYSSAQGKNAWENEGAGIFDPTGQLHSSQKAPNASPASPARFGILNSSQSQSSPVPPFPQASPQGQGQPLNDMGWVDSTQMFSAKRMVETKPGERAQEPQQVMVGVAQGHVVELEGGAGKAGKGRQVREAMHVYNLADLRVDKGQSQRVEITFARGDGTEVSAEYRMSSKKVNGFVDQITRSFGKFMCGGNALRNIDEGEQSMMVKSQAPGFTRSPAKSPAMQSFRPKLCALDFDLTLTQNQVLLYNNDENTLDMNMLFGGHRLSLIRDFCTALFEGGITLVIVTFNLKWVVEMVLRKLGVLHMFTEIYDRFEVHQALGKPSLMANLIAKYGVTGDSAILVDDDINNLNGCPCRTLHITGDLGMAPRDVTNVLEQMGVRTKM